jgi:hypothetical protein
MPLFGKLQAVLASDGLHGSYPAAPDTTFAKSDLSVTVTVHNAAKDAVVRLSGNGADDMAELSNAGDGSVSSLLIRDCNTSLWVKFVSGTGAVTVLFSAQVVPRS